MKKILCLSLFLMMLGFGIQAQEETTPNDAPVEGPVMSFESMTLDYGTIEYKGDPFRTLSFTNTGTEPLVIKSARGSCGCTTPEWPKEPIEPGASSEIKVRYATERVGNINKTVKITTNEKENNTHTIKVVGKILPQETEESVPASSPSIIGGGE